MIFGRLKSGKEIGLLPQLANRHGLITGATGTGKTVTLQKLAEEFSLAGVPVFMADVKGDLSGLAALGSLTDKAQKRLQETGQETPSWQSFPVLFWDLFQQKGIPIRTTVSEFGPLLMARLLGLNETQSSVLQLTFKMADDNGLLLLDLKDLETVLNLIASKLPELKAQYGHMSPASVGIAQRSLLTLKENGLDHFFGEPALAVEDFFGVETEGMKRGHISILKADRLLQSPLVYSTFLLWLLSELFETLPEVGDLDKPKLVFFFDEAHLLFKEAPRALLEKIEQVVRLIRSKGVGVYFVTQNPSDVPDSVLAQLGNRVQHALRSFTVTEQKAVKAAAESMRPNPEFSTAEVISQLGVGEALVSVLDENGVPTIVERVLIDMPSSKIGPCGEETENLLLGKSALKEKYQTTIDRESAFEKLSAKNSDSSDQDAQESGPQAQKGVKEPQPSSRESVTSVFSEILLGKTGPRGGHQAGVLEKAATSAVRSAASSLGRELMRGLLGGLMSGSRGSSGRR